MGIAGPHRVIQQLSVGESRISVALGQPLMPSRIAIDRAKSRYLALDFQLKRVRWTMLAKLLAQRDASGALSKIHGQYGTLPIPRISGLAIRPSRAAATMSTDSRSYSAGGIRPA